MRTIIAAAAVAALLILGVTYAAQAQTVRMVAKENADVLSGPGPNYAKVYKITPGQYVRVVNAEGRWYKVEVDGNRWSADKGHYVRATYEGYVLLSALRQPTQYTREQMERMMREEKARARRSRKEREQARAGTAGGASADRNAWGAYTELGDYSKGRQGYVLVWNHRSAKSAVDTVVRECLKKGGGSDCRNPDYIDLFSLSAPPYVSGFDPASVRIAGHGPVAAYPKRCLISFSVRLETGRLDNDLTRWLCDSKEHCQGLLREGGARPGDFHVFANRCNGERE